MALSDHDLSPVASVERSPGATIARYVATVIAVAGHALAGFGVLVSGLVAPDWARLLFGFVWVAGVIVMLRVRRRPLWLVAVPAVMWAVLFAGVIAGEQWLGWTA